MAAKWAGREVATSDYSKAHSTVAGKVSGSEKILAAQKGFWWALSPAALKVDMKVEWRANPKDLMAWPRADRLDAEMVGYKADPMEKRLVEG